MISPVEEEKKYTPHPGCTGLSPPCELAGTGWVIPAKAGIHE